MTLTLPEACEDVHFNYYPRYGFEIFATSASEEGRMYSYRTYTGNTAQQETELRAHALEGGYVSFSPVADQTLVLGSSGEEYPSSLGVFDGETLELTATLDLPAITGETGHGTSIRTYLSRCDSNLLYLLRIPNDPRSAEDVINHALTGQYERTFDCGKLYAYDLRKGAVVGTTDATVSSFGDQVDLRSHLALSCSTPHGLSIIRLQQPSEGGPQENSLIIVDPRTLETKRETPRNSQKSIIATWALKDTPLIAFVDIGNFSSMRGVLELIDGQTGDHIDADLDRFTPYEFYVRDQSSVALDNNATRLAMACDDDMLRCFDLPTGSLLWEVLKTRRAHARSSTAEPVRKRAHPKSRFPLSTAGSSPRTDRGSTRYARRKATLRPRCTRFRT